MHLKCWKFFRTYVTLEQVLLVVLEVVEHSGVCAGVRDHLAVFVCQVYDGNSFAHPERPLQVLKTVAFHIILTLILMQ